MSIGQPNRYSPASILYKSTAGRYRPVSYPDGPITARYRFIKNAHWEAGKTDLSLLPLHLLLIRICSMYFLGMTVRKYHISHETASCSPVHVILVYAGKVDL